MTLSHEFDPVVRVKIHVVGSSVNVLTVLEMGILERPQFNCFKHVQFFVSVLAHSPVPQNLCNHHHHPRHHHHRRRRRHCPHHRRHCCLWAAFLTAVSKLETSIFLVHVHIQPTELTSTRISFLFTSLIFSCSFFVLFCIYCHILLPSFYIFFTYHSISP